MRNTLLLAVLLFVGGLSCAKAQTYIKGNGALALAGIINIGTETAIAPRWTFQLDATISPWRSYGGQPLVLAMIFPEARYFFKEPFKGPYIGGHIGFGMFRMHKWGYTDALGVGDVYQVGWNGMFGASIGYQWQLGSRWMLDLFLGGGWQHATYEAFHANTAEQYAPLNWSSEWLPYRGGLMVGYKF